MRLGIAMSLPHSSPNEWAAKHSEAGLESVVFPCRYDAGDAVIDAYKRAAADYDLIIAEVGAWSNPNAPDEVRRGEAISYCKNQLALADYVGAKCCVNISGAFGEVWDGGYAENFSQRAYDRIVEVTREIIDAVRPKRTVYSLEPMPHMVPDSPEAYLKLIGDVDREGFGVHMDAVNMVSSPQIYFNNGDFIERAFSLLGKYTASCHIKDCVITHALPVSIKEVFIGEGGFDVARFLRCADAVSSDMPVIIEHLNNAELYFRAIEILARTATAAS